MHHIHSRNIAHRDIKPENLLLDENFKIKLCDFGWASEMDSKKPRYSICGTFEYMPPEVAHEDSHTLAADMWSLGILLYEMLHGHAPFRANSLEEIKLKIKKEQIRISAHFKKGTKDLIKLLLRQNSKLRLTSGQVLGLMQTIFDKELFEGEMPEGLKFELFQNYYFNKFKIVDEKVIRKKMVEDSFGAEQMNENRKMPLKYFREYKLNEDLIEAIGKIGSFNRRKQCFGLEQNYKKRRAKKKNEKIEK